MGAPDNAGAALQAAIRAGAATDLMDQAWWSPGLIHPDGGAAFALWFTGGIFVNQAGRRFVNESGPYDRIGRTIVEEMAAGPVERAVLDGLRRPPRRGPAGQGDQRVDGRYRGVPGGRAVAHCRAPWRSWRPSIGVPPTNSIGHCQPVQRDGRRRADTDFGRGDEAYDRAFSRGKPPLVPIETAPFHAAAFGLSDLGTKGGLRTDARARVLDEAGQPIPGLYAAGNTMAAVSGTTYPGGGNPIGASMLFSHLAALDMAQQR